MEQSRPLDGQEPKAKRPRSPQVNPGSPTYKKGEASDSGVPLTTPRAMASILSTWLFQYPDDFHHHPEFPCLKTIVTYIELSMAGSDLEQQAHLLLTQLEQLELPEADSDATAPAPEPAGETPLHGEPAPALLPATTPEPEHRDALSCVAAASAPLSAVDPGPSSGPPSTLPETPPLV
ncbi:ral guanine nucleotide dissociation stimulator-like isoform X4 [Camelus ferus]|nr:ral guanine nucleotide dissociation stimulator-like isoform X4 [Camelus ferus]